MAVHLWGVNLRGVSAGGGEVAAGEFRDLPSEGAVSRGEARVFVVQGKDNKGVCVETVEVQGLEAASGD